MDAFTLGHASFWGNFVWSQFLTLVEDFAGGRGTPILGHIRDVRPEWVSFPGQKPADGCTFLTKSLRMGPNLI